MRRQFYCLSIIVSLFVIPTKGQSVSSCNKEYVKGKIYFIEGKFDSANYFLLKAINNSKFYYK